MATLKELSEYTGFSIATISRVLSNDPTMSVSETTRAAILEAAGKLHYKPADRPRRLRRGARCFAIAEMLSPAEQLADPYYLYLKNYAEQRCLDLGHELVRLTETDEGYRCSAAGPLDGILAIGIFSEAQIAALTALHSSPVFLDSAPDELKYDSVVLNFRLGVEQALEYLIQRGHRRIGFLGPDCKLDQKKRPAPEVRRQYFIRYLQQKGLFFADLLFDVPMTAADARAVLLERIETGGPMPTAILAANEEAAIGAVGALRGKGLRVPEDMSIISFNDTPLSVLTDPPLTSVSTHVQTMSESAVCLLLHRMTAPDGAPPLKITVPSTLIERESVSAWTRVE